MNNEILSKSIIDPNLTNTNKKIRGHGMEIIGKTIDILAGIPIYDLVGKSLEGIIAVKEYRILKMIASFFEGFDDLTWDQRTEFAYRLTHDPNLEDFTEKLVFYLDSIDEKDKAKFVGRLARALALNRIDLEMFERSTTLIKTTFYQDLWHFASIVDFNLETNGVKYLPFENEELIITRNSKIHKDTFHFTGLSRSTIHNISSQGLIHQGINLPRLNSISKIDNPNYLSIFKEFKEEFNISISGFWIYFIALSQE